MLLAKIAFREGKRFILLSCSVKSLSAGSANKDAN